MLFARHSRSSFPIPFASGYLSSSGGAPESNKRWEIVRERGRLKIAPALDRWESDRLAPGVRVLDYCPVSEVCFADAVSP